MNKSYIDRCLRWLVNETVPFYENNSLPQALMDKLDGFYSCINRSIDWKNLTKKDVQQLGFLSWEEDDESAEKGIWFIPNWLYPVIPDGLNVFDKDYKQFEFHQETAPTDVMYGCLTFGIILS